ncbi:MAG: hypothetical protein ACTTJC_03015 [Campylobacter sp.]
MKFKLFAVYFICWLAMSFVGLFIGKSWLISSQIAFFCSIFILFTTFKAYKKRVENATLNSEISDSLGENFDENALNKSQKQGDKIENFKKNSPNYLTAFVPFRFMAYACMVVGFLSLQRNEMLDIWAFLIALGVMPLGALIFGFKVAKS